MRLKAAVVTTFCFSDHLCPPLSCGPLQVWGAGQAPAGVSIDNLGKPWATSITSCEAVRLNPTTNAVDLDSNGNQVRTYLGAGAYPYNYGDMTGTLVVP